MGNSYVYNAEDRCLLTLNESVMTVPSQLVLPQGRISSLKGATVLWVDMATLLLHTTSGYGLQRLTAVANNLMSSSNWCLNRSGVFSRLPTNKCRLGLKSLRTSGG